MAASDCCKDRACLYPILPSFLSKTVLQGGVAILDCALIKRLENVFVNCNFLKKHSLDTAVDAAASSLTVVRCSYVHQRSDKSFSSHNSRNFTSAESSCFRLVCVLCIHGVRTCHVYKTVVLLHVCLVLLSYKVFSGVHITAADCVWDQISTNTAKPVLSLRWSC